MLDAVECFMPYIGNEEGIHYFFQRLCHIVFTVEIRFIEHGVENIRRENVLDHHLGNIAERNLRIDRLFAYLEVFVARFHVILVVLLSLRHDIPERLGDIRNIFFE